MKYMLIGALGLVVAVTAPVFAQDVDVEQVKASLSAIQGDADKLKSYCEMQNLYNQAADAGEQKDEAKAEELAKQADEKSKSLGDDFEKVMESTADLDPESDAGKEVFAAFDALDKACES